MSNTVECVLPEVTKISIKREDGSVLFVEEVFTLSEMLRQSCGDREFIDSDVIDAFCVRLIEAYDLDEEEMDLTKANLIAGVVNDMVEDYKKKLDPTSKSVDSTD